MHTNSVALPSYVGSSGCGRGFLLALTTVGLVYRLAKLLKALHPFITSLV